MRAALPDLSDRAIPGAEFALRLTPSARHAALTAEGPVLAIRVSAPPAEGAANAAARTLLARALGVAPTRLRLVRGATSRHKTFRLD